MILLENMKTLQSELTLRNKIGGSIGTVLNIGQGDGVRTKVELNCAKANSDGL